MVVMVALLASTAALAQSQTAPSNTPMVGDRPLVQVKPRGATMAKTDAAKQTKAGKPSVAAQLQACLGSHEDGTKERLECYDAIFPPKPKAVKPGAKQAAAKSVADCRFTKEEDERLACFNRFAESLPKPPKT
jgi:hypothetical protein